MHVGYGAVFQNPNNQLSDREVWRQELRLAEMAEPMGFDSIWAIEHHFDDYTMCPDPVQFLTYMAGRTKHAKLGSMVIVLPWHDPIRVAEAVSMLDHVSDGRFILGIGRGLARIEYDGFRIDQNEGRNLFVEYAELSPAVRFVQPRSSHSGNGPTPRQFRRSRCRSWRSSESGCW